MTPRKSSVDEIRARFDADVERFSDLNLGQQAAPDSPLCMALVAEAAAAVTPHARSVLDVGCGAGNYTLALLAQLDRAQPSRNEHATDCTLVDLSQPMLDRAAQRVGDATTGRVTTLQGDVRDLPLGDAAHDVVLAAAVLHHLRDDEEWEAVLAKLFACLRPGGSLWVVDLIEQTHPATHAAMWRRYGDYLTNLRDEAYRDAVFAYIEQEDSPRPLVWQLRLMERVGFTHVDVLHKRLSMAAFGGIKPA